MSTLTSLARAEAVERGRAQPICTVRHLHVSERPLVVIPLALAGEACAPLAAMVGDDPDTPRLLMVAQPRDRTRRFAFAAELADVVLPYVESRFADEETLPSGRGGEPRTRYADAPQIFVPNPAATGFVHLFGRSTRFRRADGPYAVPETVPALGRWLTFFTERADHPGSCLMVAATAALAQHWATGQSPHEDLNLATLLAWIEPPEGTSGAQAAAAAEDPVAVPPTGPATDPTFDNEVLARLITAYDRAETAGDDPARRRAHVALEDALATQLEPTWRLMWQTIGLLRGLPAGGHVAARWDGDRDAFTAYAQHLREGGTPQPRRDSAVSAARRLARMERADASYQVQRAFDDPLVMAEYRLTGEAFAGTVVAAEPDHQDTSGRKRKLRPRITVETADPVLVAPEADLTSPARSTQKARVVSVAADGEPARVVLELSGGMGRALTPAPGSVPEIGETVCYATFSDRYQPMPDFPASEDTPWTHGGPPQPYVPTDEDAQEEWS